MCCKATRWNAIFEMLRLLTYASEQIECVKRRMVAGVKQHPIAGRNFHMSNRFGLLAWNTTIFTVAIFLVAAFGKPHVGSYKEVPNTAAAARIDDSVISARVASVLLADPQVSAVSFTVETRKGKVRLTGFVDNEADIERAIAVTRGVAGVKGIRVKVGPKPTKMSGEQWRRQS